MFTVRALTRPLRTASRHATRYSRRNNATTTATAPKTYYLTTPIFYVNAAPHIGHLHSLLLTDLLARYTRLRHPDTPVRFATGTDEHGLKIQQAAQKEAVEPGVFCDGISERFRNLASVANVSNTDFIRTTAPQHRVAVQHFWRTIEAAGHIYKGSHSGYYAVSDECFYTAQQITDVVDPVTGEVRKVATESGSAVEWTEEENYKFRLSAFQDRLITWLSEDGVVHPAWLRQELLTTLKSQTLPDLSISRPRSRLSWGIPVPGDEQHTIYVWVDALTNYLTVLGYPWAAGEGEGEGRDAGWPADVQVVGKDIVRFHAIYWPALLMAASLPPPRQILAHAHWTMGNAKMSKSRGNVADPVEVMTRQEGVGVDGLRWYLMRNGGALSSDADYSADELNKQYSLLATRLGNLVGRISSPKIQKRFLAAAESTTLSEPAQNAPERELWDMLVNLQRGLETRLDKLEITAAMQDVMEIILEANRIFTLLQPWTPSTPPGDLVKAMTLAHDSLRLAGIALQPVMPGKMEDLLDRLGVENDERGWEELRRVGEVKGVVARVEKMKEGAKDVSSNHTWTNWGVFNGFEPTTKGYRLERTYIKPLSVIVLTDGAATDDSESVIVSVASRCKLFLHTGLPPAALTLIFSRLDRGGFSPNQQLGIQFIQIGNESEAKEAKEALQALDDGIKERHEVRDIVDTVVYHGDGAAVSVKQILKILLGGIQKRLDEHEVPQGREGFV